nr:MAG TPA: hypothetical protein [Caudoviricetes sp.]
MNKRIYSEKTYRTQESTQRLTNRGDLGLRCQRKVSFIKNVSDSMIPFQQRNLYSSWKADKELREFLDIEEMIKYMKGETDYIGTMKKNSSQGKWVRFDNRKKYVLGENHNDIVLSDFMDAVHSRNFQHERFSKIYKMSSIFPKTADHIEGMNEKRYAMYNIDAAAERSDIDKYALESPIPKIAYCMECVLEQPEILEQKESTDSGNGYSLPDTYRTYIELSLSVIEDIMGKEALGEPVKKPFQSTLRFVKQNNNWDIIKLLVFIIKNGFNVPKNCLDFLCQYFENFVYDVLTQANNYAEKIGKERISTGSDKSDLVKYRKIIGGDFTNPILENEHPQKIDIISALRDEKMINYIRDDVKYVGMGNAHAIRLKSRLENKGFTVIHTPKIKWKDYNVF